MNTAQQLRLLEQQRDEHLRHATLHYARLKRDLRRASSPTRLVRKNMAVSIGTAFAAGIILAPGPRRDASAPRGPSVPRRLLAMLTRAFPQLKPLLHITQEPTASPIEAPTPPQPAPPPPPKTSMLGTLLAHIVSQIEWNMLLSALVSRLTQPHPAPASSAADQEEMIPQPSHDESATSP